MTTCRDIQPFQAEYRINAMTGRSTDDNEPPTLSDEATERQRAHDQMIARHKLIEGMIRNNESQLKNESARCGAEIDREGALRDVARGIAGAQAELEQATARLQALRGEHGRLVAEREWLNSSLLEFENDPSANDQQRSGRA
jgi:predicted  nucleic acid-binding Zn-ribbon protein